MYYYIYVVFLQIVVYTHTLLTIINCIFFLRENEQNPEPQEVISTRRSNEKKGIIMSDQKDDI